MSLWVLGMNLCDVWTGNQEKNVAKKLTAVQGITALVFREDGRILGCACTEGRILLLNTKDWSMVASVYIFGTASHISFHPDGNDVLLGCSLGEIRNWNLVDEELSAFNIAVARVVVELSFRKNGIDIVVGTADALTRVWSCPLSNTSLNVSDDRTHTLYDFHLSANGTRAVSQSVKDVFCEWNMETGTLNTSYSACDKCQYFAISMDRKTIALTNMIGTIRLWNAELGPGELDPCW